jgi:hypothetical protein
MNERRLIARINAEGASQISTGSSRLDKAKANEYD